MMKLDFGIVVRINQRIHQSYCCYFVAVELVVVDIEVEEVVVDFDYLLAIMKKVKNTLHVLFDMVKIVEDSVEEEEHRNLHFLVVADVEFVENNTLVVEDYCYYSSSFVAVAEEEVDIVEVVVDQNYYC